ncbi:unnamed protein product [Closterium sp. NIES-64]|nr:unnamed protein product [Closterium sp. NIES-64]
MAQSGRAGSAAAAALRHVLLLQRDVPRAANFFKEGLGLPVLVCTERWAEVQAGPTRIALQQCDRWRRVGGKGRKEGGGMGGVREWDCCERERETEGRRGGDGEGGVGGDNAHPDRSAAMRQVAETCAGERGEGRGGVGDWGKNTAHTAHGFSPLLSFSVRGEGEFDSTLLRMLRLGAVMDGAVVHIPQGRVAALRAPDGPMLSLVEESEEA